MVTQLLICPAGRKINDFNSILQGYMIGSSRFVKSTFCAHGNDDMAPCVQWGWEVHYLDNYCSVRRWKPPNTHCGHCLWSTGLPIHSAALVSSLPVHHPSNPVTVCDSRLSTVGRRKKCINNVFLGCIHPRINGNTKTIYKDSWLKAIFDHFHCARSLLLFCQPAETQLFPSVCKLLLKEHEVNI